jgi:hypothetical protein
MGNRIIYKSRFLQAALIFFMSLVSQALAGTYYVTNNGNASWSACTDINTPCSPATAMNNVRAGDTVYFRGGDYYPPDVSDPSTPSWYPRSSGTAAQPISIMAYPGETPTVYQPLGTSSNGGLGAAFNGYIIFDGFKFIKRKNLTENYLWHCYETSHITIRNSEFVGLDAQDYHNHVGVANNNCNYLYVYNNVFRNFTNAGAPQSNIGATWFFSTDHVWVYNNDFINCSNGIQTKVNMSYVYAYNNFFYNVYQPFHWQQQTTGVTDFHIYNNIAVLPSGGAFLYAADPVNPFYVNNVYNNTIYCTSACTGFLIGNSNTRNLNVWNNIIFGAGGTTVFASIPSGVGVPEYMNYNDYYLLGSGNWAFNSTSYSSIDAWRTTTRFELNSVTSDPQFINPGGRNAVDYKRRSYTANGRSGAYASVMGAYVTGNEKIGALPKPKNLR